MEITEVFHLFLLYGASLRYTFPTSLPFLKPGFLKEKKKKRENPYFEYWMLKLYIQMKMDYDPVWATKNKLTLGDNSHKKNLE